MITQDESDLTAPEFNTPEQSIISHYEDANNVSKIEEHTMISDELEVKKKKARPQKGRKRTKKHPKPKNSPGKRTPYLRLEDVYFILTGLFFAIATFIHFIEIETNDVATNNQRESQNLYNSKQIDALYAKFPNLLSPKEIRIIKSRLAAHTQEVSILMLLGRSRDYNCRLDPTYCIGQTIANVTTKQYGYIDASDPSVITGRLERELSDSLVGDRRIVMIDSLERLHGSKVMNLFQFIDRDHTQPRRGMLILTVYMESLEPQTNLTRLKGPEIVEKVLTNSWSTLVPQDSLNSVISRIVPSLVKLV